LFHWKLDAARADFAAARRSRRLCFDFDSGCFGEGCRRGQVFAATCEIKNNERKWLQVQDWLLVLLTRHFDLVGILVLVKIRPRTRVLLDNVVNIEKHWLFGSLHGMESKPEITFLIKFSRLYTSVLKFVRVHKV
jgi:hypothetical protein